VWAAGIQLGKTEDVTIRDCLLHRVRNGLIVQDAVQTRLTHNTIFHTRAHGVYLVSGSDTVLQDNIIVAGGRSGSALYVGPPAATGLQADYNCYLDSGTPALISWMPLGLRFATFGDYRGVIVGQDQHSLSADPLFASTTPGREDFRLCPDSPCRGRASEGGDLGVRWP
jgi:parallel beta-helix repeat protein